MIAEVMSRNATAALTSGTSAGPPSTTQRSAPLAARSRASRRTSRGIRRRTRSGSIESRQTRAVSVRGLFLFFGVGEEICAWRRVHVDHLRGLLEDPRAVGGARRDPIRIAGCEDALLAGDDHRERAFH